MLAFQDDAQIIRNAPFMKIPRPIFAKLFAAISLAAFSLFPNLVEDFLSLQTPNTMQMHYDLHQMQRKLLKEIFG